MVNQEKSESPSASEPYQVLGVDQLLTYAANRILQNGEECTLERLVYECFTLFPKKFSFSRYPQWPDSTRIYRSCRRCLQDNKWLSGSFKDGFQMKSEGEKIALDVGVKLKDPATINQKVRQPIKTRGKEEAVIRYLRKSESFNRWEQDKTSFKISESELRSLLNATLETPINTLKDNIVYYKENAGLVRDTVMISFLDECEKQHSNLLRG